MQLRFNPSPQLLGDFPRAVVRHMVRRDEDPDLSPRLDRKRLLHAFKREREFLQSLQPLHVARHRLGPRTRPGRRNRIRQDHNTRVDRLGFHLFMMRRHGVGHDRGFAIALDELRADQRMTALKFTRRRFADIVQESRPLRQVRIKPDLARDHRRQERGLHRMIERVLAVGKPILQLAEQLYDLGMQPIDVELRHRLFARLRRDQLDILPRPLHKLLDARRMDPAVFHQRIQRGPGNLAPHRVKRRQQHQLGRLVDHERHTRRGFKRFDVTPLAADDPAFHFFARQRHQRRRQIIVRLARDALHRGDENPPRIGLQLLLRLLQNLPPHRPQLILTLQRDLLAQGSPDVLGVHL